MRFNKQLTHKNRRKSKGGIINTMFKNVTNEHNVRLNDVEYCIFSENSIIKNDFGLLNTLRQFREIYL